MAQLEVMDLQVRQISLDRLSELNGETGMYYRYSVSFVIFLVQLVIKCLKDLPVQLVVFNHLDYVLGLVFKYLGDKLGPPFYRGPVGIPGMFSNY